MNLETALNSLLASDANSISMVDIAISVTLPFLMSFVITTVFQMTQGQNNYSRGFIHTIFLFSCLTSIVTMIIGSNIARAFGLVGALSVIRFRNALKSPMEAAYIFWALVLGMACGTGFYFAGILLTLLVASFALFLNLINYGDAKYRDSILKVITEQDLEAQTIPEVESILAKTARSYKRINVLFDSETNVQTHVYMVREKKDRLNSTVREAINGIKGVVKTHHLNSEAGSFSY